MIDTDWRQLNRSFFDVLEVEATSCSHPDPDHARRGAEHHFRLDHVGKDKNADIAILRTMGAPRGSIMRIFLITGATIGIAGTGVGVVLGLLVADNVEPIRSGLS